MRVGGSERCAATLLHSSRFNCFVMDWIDCPLPSVPHSSWKSSVKYHIFSPRLTVQCLGLSGFPARMPPEPHSLFPDRPIRPLPKRRLRERLTPDVADAIPFPPAPGSGVPLFAYPWNTKDEPPVPGSEPPSFIGRETTPEATHEPFVPTAVSEPKSQDETPLMRSRRAQGSRKFHDVPTPLPLRGTPRPGQLRQPSAPQPSSLPPSTDGYDSFENTNNKKKRKIPTAGEVILNGTHPLNDQATLGILSAAASVEEDGPESVAVASAPYYQTAGPAISNQGISGSSRGRYARVRNGRSPLRTLSDPNSLWPGRSPKLRGQFALRLRALNSFTSLSLAPHTP